MKEKICILQIGRLGDTIICLPIAKYYHDNGYLVDWIVSERYKDVFDYADYVDNVIEVPKTVDIVYEGLNYAYNDILKYTSHKYKKIIDLSICFPYSRVMSFCNRSFLESFVHVKYNIANVDISERYKLSIIRNKEKELSLLELVTKDIEPYILVHNTSSEGKLFNYNNKLNVVEFREIDGYNIFDWYQVILNASLIYCCDSSLCNFIDGISEFKDIKKYYIVNKQKTPTTWDRTPIKNNWIILNES